MKAWKNLLALALGVIFVGLLEGSLALFGVRPLADADPFVGFAGSQPLFVPDPAEGGTYRLNPGKAVAFNPQTFAMPKPKGTFRIVAFGGSTTYGHPYIGRTAFPAWLAQLLKTADPGRTYEAINAGGISYASYRVRRLVEELADYEPDLFVVYSGHNEFLEKRTFDAIINERPALRRLRFALHRSRLYTAVYRSVGALKKNGAGKTILGDSLEVTLEQVGGPNLYHRDEVFRRGVIEEFRLNIRAITRFARQRRIPLVLCTVSSNLSGVSPFKSEHRLGLSPAQSAEWGTLFADAGAAFSAGEHALALSLLERAAAIDDRVAMLHFARGQILQSLNKGDEAREAFIRAKEEDIIPLRALEEFNAIVREIAREELVPLADVEARFRQFSPAGITGPPLFVDHVHPAIEGQQSIALNILEAGVGAGAVPLTPERWAAARESALARLKAERSSAATVPGDGPVGGGTHLLLGRQATGGARTARRGMEDRPGHRRDPGDDRHHRTRGRRPRAGGAAPAGSPGHQSPGRSFRHRPGARRHRPGRWPGRDRGADGANAGGACRFVPPGIRRGLAADERSGYGD